MSRSILSFAGSLLPSRIFFVVFLAFGLLACGEDSESPEPIEELVRFERQSNLVGQRAELGRFSMIGDRLYYSNEYNPGYFEEDGNQEQTSFRQYDMRFGHVFTSDYTVGVLGNRRALAILPNVDYSTSFTRFLDYQVIPDLPSDFLLQPGWSEVPNFGLNENFLISSWEGVFEPGESNRWDRVFILELNSVPNEFGNDAVYVDRTEPVLNKIPVDYTSNGNKMSGLISVFPFEEGWIASAMIDGYETTFKIERDGTAKPLRDELGRFVIYSLEQGPEGDLFAADEEGLLYSQSGSPFELQRIATANVLLRFRFIGDRLLVWVGSDQLFELKNYRDPATIQLVELENAGLEGVWIKDAALFGGKFYVATNAGLFLKEEAEFWKEKEQTPDPSMGMEWELK